MVLRQDNKDRDERCEGNVIEIKGIGKNNPIQSIESE